MLGSHTAGQSRKPRSEFWEPEAAFPDDFKKPAATRDPLGLDRIGETRSGHWNVGQRLAPKLTDNRIEVFGRSRE